MVDTEASAPRPKRVMLTCGLVKLDKGLTHRFYGRFRPPADAEWNPHAEKTHGISRTEAAGFPDAGGETRRMLDWLHATSGGRKVRLISDNPAFDAAWLFAAVHEQGNAIFGHSARRIGDLYCGLVGDFDANEAWKRLYRDADAHTHNALDDAVANARTLLRRVEAHPLAGLVPD